MSEQYKDSWIGINEAAEYLGVTKETIRNWIKKQNGIPAQKIGKLWKFKRSELRYFRIIGHIIPIYKQNAESQMSLITSSGCMSVSLQEHQRN